MGETATLEEAVEEVDKGTAEQTKSRLRLPWPRRKSAGEASTTEESAEPAVEDDPAPLAYRTFSPKIAPGFTAVGGTLAIVGGLGTWVRATRVVTEGLPAEQVAITMGYDDPEGLTIAVFGAVALLTSFFWLRQRPLFNVLPSLALKLVPTLASAAIIGLAIWQLQLMDFAAQDLAQAAIQRADFVSFHAGLGWGAWCLVVAGVLLFLGTVIGILREIDLKRGTSA